MEGLFGLEVDGLAGLDGHALRAVAYGLTLSALDGIEERGHHGIHELGVSGCVLVVGVRDVSVGPLPVALVDGAEHIGGRHVPFVDEQVELLHIAVVALHIVAAGIVVHHHRNLPVGFHFIDEFQHVVAPLVEDILLIAGSVDAFVAQRETEDDVASEVANQVVVAVQQVVCRIAADADVGCVEGCRAATFLVAVDELLAIEVAIAFVVGGTLSVGDGRTEDRDAVLVDGSIDVVLHLVHVDGDGIGTGILIDVLRALSFLHFSEVIARRSAFESLDGKGIIVVQGKVHGLVHPLLRRCFRQGDFSLEDACSLVGDGGIASGDVAANVHRDGHDGDGGGSGVDGDACHTVLRHGEGRAARSAEGAIAIVEELDGLAIGLTGEGEVAGCEACIYLIYIITEHLERCVLGITAKLKAGEDERFFRSRTALILLHPHGADVSHAHQSLHGDEDVAVLVRVDVVTLQDVAKVAVVAFAADAGAGSGLTARPGALAGNGVEGTAVGIGVARAVDVEAVAMVGVEFCQAEGTHIAVVDEDVVLGCCLDGKVAQVVSRRVVVATCIDAVAVSLVHDDEASTGRLIRLVLDGKRLVGRNGITRTGARVDVVPIVAVRVLACRGMTAGVVVDFAEVEVHLLHEAELLVRAFQTGHLLYLHAVEVDHDAGTLLAYCQEDVAVPVGENVVGGQHLVVVAVVSVVTDAGARHHQLSLPDVLAAQLEVCRPGVCGRARAEEVEAVGFGRVESLEVDDAVVLSALQEDVVLRGTLDGEVAQEGCRRTLQAAVGIAVGGEARRELQAEVRLFIVGSQKVDGLRIGLVGCTCAFAEDVVPVVLVLVGTRCLVPLAGHIVLTKVHVERTFLHLRSCCQGDGQHDVQENHSYLKHIDSF